MINWFKKRFKPKEKPVVTQLFSFAGHTFQVLEPMKMHVSRQEAMHSKQHHIDTGLAPEKTAEALRTLANSLKMPYEWKNSKELLSKMQNNASDVSVSLEDIATLIESPEKHIAYIKVGAVFILIDDEDQNDEPFGKHYAKKLELCEKHPEIRTFFLRISHYFHQSMTFTSDVTTLWEWYPSKATQHLENKVIKLIPSMTS